MQRTPDTFGLAARLQRFIVGAMRLPDAGHELRDEARALLPLVYDMAAPSIVFHPAEEPDVWVIGRGASARPLHAAHVGVRGAYLALTGARPRSADLVEGGNADGILRHAVRHTAADWAESVARCPELAAAMRRMRVIKGRLESADGAMFVLCSQDFTRTVESRTIEA